MEKNCQEIVVILSNAGADPKFADTKRQSIVRSERSSNADQLPMHDNASVTSSTTKTEAKDRPTLESMLSTSKRSSSFSTIEGDEFKVGAILSTEEIEHIAKALFEETTNGNLRKIKALLKTYKQHLPEFINRTEPSLGRSALILAAEHSYKDIAWLLIRAGADVDLIDQTGSTAFHYAAEFGSSEIAMLLIASKANPAVANKNGNMPLYIAAKKGHADIVRRIISTATNQKEAAFVAAVKYGHASAVDVFLQGCSDLDINAVDNHGRTMVYVCCERGHVDVLQSLLAAKANVNIPEERGYAPLYTAAFSGFKEIIALLISAGADLNHLNDGYTALSAACLNGYADIVSLLISAKAELNTVDKDGATALKHAASSGHVSIVQQLIDTGTVDLNKRTVSGRTALYSAALNNHINAVRILLKAGADPSIADFENLSPIQVTSNDQVKYLLHMFSSHKFGKELKQATRFDPSLFKSNTVKTSLLSVLKAAEEEMFIAFSYLIKPLNACLDRIFLMTEESKCFQPAMIRLNQRLALIFAKVLYDNSLTGINAMVTSFDAEVVVQHGLISIQEALSKTELKLLPYTDSAKYLAYLLHDAKLLCKCLNQLDSSLIEVIQQIILKIGVDAPTVELDVISYDDVIPVNILKMIENEYDGLEGLIERPIATQQVANLIGADVKDFVSAMKGCIKSLTSFRMDVFDHETLEMIEDYGDSGEVLVEDVDPILDKMQLNEESKEQLVRKYRIDKGHFIGEYKGNAVLIVDLEALQTDALKGVKQSLAVQKLLSDILPQYVVPIYACDLSTLQQSRPFMVMEAADFTLGDTIYRTKVSLNLSFLEKLMILHQIAQTMSAVHRMGVIHGDIQPANILLSLYKGPSDSQTAPLTQFHVKLHNFGLDKALLGSSRKTLDNSGYNNCFTYKLVSYNAPETMKRVWPFYSKESDVYSFGVLINELMAECKPFHQKEPFSGEWVPDFSNPTELMKKIVENGTRPKLFNVQNERSRYE